MRSVTVIILHASIVLAPAKELAATVNDKVVDKLLDKLIDRISTSIDYADLDKTTLAKTHPDATLGTMTSRVAPMTSRGVTPFLPNFASPSVGHRTLPRVEAMRGNYMPAVSATSASPVTVMPFPAAQSTLKSYGFGSSPFQELALAQIASTRDPSMRGEVQKVFASMDPVHQNTVKKLSKEVIVRAESLVDTIKLEEMAGITAPFGFLDPLGMSNGKGSSDLYFFREVELKHGRLAMLGTLGIVVAEKFHPLYGANADWTNAAEYHIKPVLLEKFWPATVLLAGIAELFLLPQDTDKLPGDLGFDPLNFKPKDPKAFLELQNKELNNGRLAMVAAAGMLAEELVWGKLHI